MRTKTPEQAIEDAKLMLDGARDIYAHNPTSDFRLVVEDCESELNDLLDGYAGRDQRGTSTCQ